MKQLYSFTKTKHYCISHSKKVNFYYVNDCTSVYFLEIYELFHDHIFRLRKFNNYLNYTYCIPSPKCHSIKSKIDSLHYLLESKNNIGKANMVE